MLDFERQRNQPNHLDTHSQNISYHKTNRACISSATHYYQCIMHTTRTSQHQNYGLNSVCELFFWVEPSVSVLFFSTPHGFVRLCRDGVILFIASNKQFQPSSLKPALIIAVVVVSLVYNHNYNFRVYACLVHVYNEAARLNL